jgi:myo-inositol-1(or 4)-monophosphatase
MRDSALAAGTLALKYKHRAEGNKSWDKGGDSPVTEADLAVNSLLAEKLLKARPNYGWLSEETADVLSARQKQRVWVVDPIDGTRAFMRENDPYWCTAMAVVENGIAVAGVIYAPMFGELYEARLGGGAFLNGDPISVSQKAEETGARLITNRTLVEHPNWPEKWPDVEVSDPIPNATLYRMALVAAGKWDATLALFRKFDWDLAPGAILLTEAGGNVSTHIGEELRFNRQVPAQRSMVVAGKGLHPLLIERLKHVDLPEPNP